MIIFKKGRSLHQYMEQARIKGLSIGWVPTMGALHPGHLFLLEKARAMSQLVVCSIFVNPTQFNDKKDFEKYPITLEKDILMLEEKGSDILFLPGLEEIYPDGTDALEKYDLGQLELILEGKFRPGHFQGVCQVMHRLIGIIDADHLFMGQKDYQQCLVIQKLLDITGSDLKLHVCPTQRETDGLAMSSRNMRLSETERKHAVAIYEALNFIKNNLKKGSLESLIQEAGEILRKKKFRIDYIAIADGSTLEPVPSWEGNQDLVGLIAAFQGEVRLIDNLLLTGSRDLK